MITTNSRDGWKASKMCLMMEWDGTEWKADESIFNVTNIYLIIKCAYWHVTFELGIQKH